MGLYDSKNKGVIRLSEQKGTYDCQSKRSHVDDVRAKRVIWLSEYMESYGCKNKGIMWLSEHKWSYGCQNIRGHML